MWYHLTTSVQPRGFRMGIFACLFLAPLGELYIPVMWGGGVEVEVVMWSVCVLACVMICVWVWVCLCVWVLCVCVIMCVCVWWCVCHGWLTEAATAMMSWLQLSYLKFTELACLYIITSTHSRAHHSTRIKIRKRAFHIKIIAYRWRFYGPDSFRHYNSKHIIYFGTG